MAAEETLLEKARRAVAERGPICDSEGFYQHTGECYSDATQMAFLFSDGLKEILQPSLLEKDITAEEIQAILTETLSAKTFRRRHGDKVDGYVSLLKHLQNRLARHILAEYERIDTCPMGSSPSMLQAPAMKEMFRVKGANAFGTIGGIKGWSGANYVESPTAFSGDDLSVFILLMNLLFFNTTIQVNTVNTHQANAYIFSILVPSSGLGPSEGHGLALYTCGGQDFMYEDNNGPFLFPWRKFVEKYPSFFPCSTFTVKDKASGEIVFKTNWYPIAKKQRAITMIHGIEGEIEVAFGSTTEYDLGETLVTLTIPPEEIAQLYYIKEGTTISVPPGAVAAAPVPFRYGARPLRLEANRGGGKKRTKKNKKRSRRARNSKLSSRSACRSKNR